jgi:outer membrane protein TolC
MSTTMVGSPRTASRAISQPPAELMMAFEERAAAAEAHIKILESLFQHGGVSIEQVLTAQRSWFLSYREAPVSPGRLVEVAIVYRDRIRARYKLAEIRFQSGVRSEADLAAVRCDLAEAEYWLEEAKWKLQRELRD